MRILELILRIILRLIEALSSKPSEAPPLEGNSNTTTKITTNSDIQASHSMDHGNGKHDSHSDSKKSITVYSDEVNELLCQVMTAHRATEEADMNEIIRLRQELSKLQQELILAKASVKKSDPSNSHNANAKSSESSDARNESSEDDVKG